jgi:hypothetical protein
VGQVQAWGASLSSCLRLGVVAHVIINRIKDENPQSCNKLVRPTPNLRRRCLAFVRSGSSIIN